MTHEECVGHACEIARRLGFKLIIPEMNCRIASGEIPDVIAFKGGGISLVIECKVSRADFLADRAKPFRAEPQLGMGYYRLFVVAEGVLSPDNALAELPKGWQYIEINEEGYPSRASIKAVGNMTLCGIGFKRRNISGETALLYSYIRRRDMLNEKEYRLTHKDKSWIAKE